MSNAKLTEYPYFVTHMECSLTGEIYEAGIVQGLSKAGRPLLVRYNLAELSRHITKTELAKRKGGFWRFGKPTQKNMNKEVSRTQRADLGAAPVVPLKERAGCRTADL